MSARHFFPIVSLSLCIMGNIIGCAAPGTERAAAAGDFAGERLLNTDVASARSAAVRALRREFRIDPEASTQTRLISEPAEVEGRGETARVRDVLTLSPNRQRRIAEIRLVQEGPDVLVQSRVRVQRLDVSERAAFANERGDDRPSETQIDRRQMSAADRREDWTDIGRDRNMEREILESIQNRFASTAPAE